MEAVDRLIALVNILISKLNYLHSQFSQFGPTGISNDADNSLTLGTDDKPYFKQRTANEIADAYEGLDDTNKFTDDYKDTLDNLNVDLEDKLDRGGYEGTAQDIVNLISSDKIEIEGNSFNYLPVLGNPGIDLQTGDIAYYGWIDQTTFGKLLSFTGTNGTGLNDSTFSDWDIIEQI